MLDRSPRSGSDRPLGPNLLVRSESDPYVRLVAAPTSPGAGPAGPAADGRCKSEESTASSTATEVLSHGRAWLVQRSQSLNVGQPITLHTEPFSLFSLAQPIDTDKDGRGVAHRSVLCVPTNVNSHSILPPSSFPLLFQPPNPFVVGTGWHATLTDN